MTDITNPADNPGSEAFGTSDDTTPTIDLTAQIGYLAILLRRSDMARGHGRRGFGGEIRSGQGRVLGILALQSPLTQKNLAFMLGVRPQSLSELVSKLETKGLVTRQRDENDRRSFLIELTEAGRDAAAEIDSISTDEPFDALSDDERATFTTLAQKVIDAIEDRFPEMRNHGGRRGHGHWGGPDVGPGFGPGFGPHHRWDRRPGPGAEPPHPHNAEFHDVEHPWPTSPECRAEDSRISPPWEYRACGPNTHRGFGRGRTLGLRGFGRAFGRGFGPRFA